MTEDNVLGFPGRPGGDRIGEMLGPERRGHRVIVEGRQIPGLVAYERGEQIELCLDDRLSIDVPRDLAPQVAWLVANALAVGAGYPFLGAVSRDAPFAPQVVSLGEVPK